MPLSRPLQYSHFVSTADYLFMDKRPYKATARLQSTLEKAGVNSAVIVLMRSKPDRRDVMYPYCHYFMICDVTDRARTKYTKKVQRDAVLDDPDDDDKQRLFEEEVLCAVTAAVGFRAGRQTFEASWPEKFAAEREFWIVDGIIRTGRLRNNTLVTDDDLLNHLVGNSGTGIVSYNGVASPDYPASWQVAKQQICRCLVGNSTWEQIATACVPLN